MIVVFCAQAPSHVDVALLKNVYTVLFILYILAGMDIIFVKILAVFCAGPFAR